MQVSVESTSELGRKLTVQVPEEKVQQEMDSRLKKLAQTVKIDGFRPGKVPQRVVKSRFGGQVRDEVFSELIQSSFFDAVKEHKLNPAGTPKVTPKELEKGAGFEFEAEFEVYPEITLPDFSLLEVTKPVSEVADDDVNGMIDKLRQQQQSWKEVDRDSKDGDRLHIDFDGTVDGESFTNGKVENFEVVLGSGRMIPGFEDALVGLKKGATHTFNVTFPEDYPEKKLAGKEVSFDIEVKKVEEGAPPELDDEFAKSYGIEEGGVDALIADIRENMQKELDQALQARAKTAVMDVLIENTPVTLPSILVDEEAERLAVPYKTSSKEGAETNIPREELRVQAERRVKLGLIMSEIIRKNDMSVDKDRLRSTIEDLARSYEKPEDVVNWYYSNDEQLRQMEQVVLESQLVDWLLDQAKVTDEKVAFDKIMQPEAA